MCIYVKGKHLSKLNVRNREILNRGPLLVSRGVLPIMAYTGRLRPKGVPYSGFRYIKGKGFHKFRYMKG